jgi:hypothetical protein
MHRLKIEIPQGAADPGFIRGGNGTLVEVIDAG